MNLEALSERIRDHLTQQKERSLAVRRGGEAEEVRMVCAYRGENNTCCAVGCLISDEAYDATLEGSPANRDPVVSALFKSLGEPVTQGTIFLLLQWQHYHDGMGYGGWVKGEEQPSPAEIHESLRKSTEGFQDYD